MLVIFGLIIVLIIGFLFVYYGAGSGSRENFEIIYTPYPNWFDKKPYDINDWFVVYYPDKIQPNCLPYDVNSRYGSIENMNYNSSAYKFWRM
jgi:hypothetical protein